MQEFESWRSYWRFEVAVTQRARYFRDPDVERFLGAVQQTGEKRGQVLFPGHPLWRAQLGNYWEPIYQQGEHVDDSPTPYPPERMKPATGRAMEGRANVKGIPCLYLATKPKTVMMEVRPWNGSFISVGQFKARRQLRVINCE